MTDEKADDRPPSDRSDAHDGIDDDAADITRPPVDDELSARLQARTEELFGTGAIDVIAPAVQPKPDLQWAPYEPLRRGIGGSALAFSLAALGGSFVVAWMFPLGILSLVLGVIAVRRPEESTSFGRWAIGLSILSLVYSAGWAWWVGTKLGWWG